MRELSKRILTGATVGPIVFLLFCFLPPRMLLLFLFVVACMAVYVLLSISGSRDRLIVGALAVLSMLPLHAGSAGNFLIWVMFSPLVYLGFRVIKPSDDPSAPNEEIDELRDRAPSIEFAGLARSLGRPERALKYSARRPARSRRSFHSMSSWA